jgi:serine/threonine-protein kinase
MQPERWRRVCAVLEGALELGPEERAEWLRDRCSREPEIRDEVESLLRADRRAGRFLEQPLGRASKASAAAGATAGAADPRPPERLGPYRLLEPLGHGGTSSVYLAVRGDDEYRQRVAVKILRPGVGSDAGRRLRVERQILAHLDHPNIARFLYGDTTGDGLPFFAMELVEGVRVDRYCREHQLSIEQRLELFLEICSAVEYAHRNLVVHRDLKPGNILVTRDGRPKLLDFGIAKLLDPELAGPESATTVHWLRVLTPAYASPEQVRGEPISTATDVYSLGVLLYELLTGVLPIPLAGASGAGSAPPSTAEIERAVLEQEPRRPSAAVVDAGRPELRRHLAGDLDQIVLKALRKEPGHRYSSVERLAEDIHRHLRGEPVRARKGTLAYRTGRFLRRHRWQTAAAAAFLATVLGFTAAVAHQASRIRAQAEAIAAERDEARAESEKRRRVLEFLEQVFTRVGELEAQGQRIDAAGMLSLGVEMAGERGDEPEVQADLLSALGRNLERVRRWDEAETTHRTALGIRTRIFGDDSLAAGRSLYDLSSVSYQLGRYPEAERRARRAVELIRRHLGQEDPEVAEALTNLATVVYTRQRSDEAEALFRQALEIRRRRLGDDHPLVVASLNHLGLTLASGGRHREAEAHLREALAIQRRGDPSDWDLAYNLNNLAFALQEQGELDAAEPLLAEALAIWRRTLAEDDPQIGIALQGLGRLRLAQGAAAEAEAVLREHSKLVASSAPPGHWDRAQAAALLGAALCEQGRSAEAEPLLAESLRVLTAERGADHRDARLAREHLRHLDR